MHIVYCDDIRQEIGNKLSLIGVYGADLLVAEFPVVLPKLAVVVTVVTPKATPFTSLAFTLYKDEQVLLEQSFAATDLDSMRLGVKSLSTAPISFPDAIELESIRAAFILSPFPVEKSSMLRVVVRTEDGELRGPALCFGLLEQLALGSASAPTKPPH